MSEERKTEKISVFCMNMNELYFDQSLRRYGLILSRDIQSARFCIMKGQILSDCFFLIQDDIMYRSEVHVLKSKIIRIIKSEKVPN